MEQRRRRRGWRLRLHTTLELIRANPTGRVALKIFIGILGALVVTIGIALIPLPGPGWLLVIAGLGVWAVEFHWARRLLAFTRRHVNSWTQWVKRQSLGVRFVLGRGRARVRVRGGVAVAQVQPRHRRRGAGAALPRDALRPGFWSGLSIG